MLKCFKFNVDKLRYPNENRDLLKVIAQANDNNLKLKYCGGTFPVSKDSSEVVKLSLRSIKRILSYDPLTSTILVEPGITLKELVNSMEYLDHTLDLYGTVPNMTVADAINVGLIGSNGTIGNCLTSCQVVNADMSTSDWTWPTAEQIPDSQARITRGAQFTPSLQTLVCGLGVVGVISKCTLKCVPMKFVQENIYHSDLEPVLDRVENFFDSMYVDLQWFPLLGKVIVINASLVRVRDAHLQPWWLYCFEQLCWSFHWFTERVSPFLSWYFTGHATLLSYMQYLLMRSACLFRSEFSHKPQKFVSISSHCRGVKWVLPLDNFEHTITDLESWSRCFPYLCTTPLLISVQDHQNLALQQPFLSPYSNNKTFTIWSDWFGSSSISDAYSASMAEYETLLQKNGGRKCWSAGPVYASPLIGQMYPGFRHFCETCAILDPKTMFRSSYVEGDIFGEQY